MSDPFKVVVVGPLAPFASDFHVFLSGLGYSPDSASQKLQLVAHLSRWMVEQGLAVQALSPGVVEEFFAVRRQGYRNFRTPRSLTPFFDFLERARIDRVADPPPMVSPRDKLLADFEQYLTGERGLRPTTIVNYLNQVRPFLGWRAERSGSDWASLSIAEVTDFLLWRGRTETIGSIRVAATALRAFLRWLFLVSVIPHSLAEGIPAVAYSPYAGLPKFLTQIQVQAIANGTARKLVPLRNQALLLVLSRMGLRAREVQDLTLDDIDWRVGIVRVTGKGGRIEAMPLPVDAGAAIVNYLQNERPTSSDRHLFLQATAPHRPLRSVAISQMVTSRAAGAGIGFRVGAHRLRHSVATAILDQGGSLEEAAQLLRHSSASTTVNYAKVNLEALRLMAVPWPVAAGNPGAVGHSS
ncbi:site-specific integrase [Pseudarthrobacter sp. R1]|uniref:tyrosine-type recombinase/integrase n=1 Tax=Pseudarthrobacter sp. R1 TaxID=2944934 RepID=UPI00210B01CE|nr:tyrosine-type recombinase/integrase [Pseudarthrobacter sp. R1]MCQ6269281.1 site-specific integrase [Pseudarthrobacter sp. R1]